MTRMTMTFPAVLAATVIGAASAAAQLPGAGDEAEEIARLESRAEELLHSTRNYGRVASLFHQAADLRAPADAKGVHDLMMAARLSYYAGRETDAVRYFRNAGERAIAMGDVITAASAFLDGAWVAGKRGRGVQATALLDRARLLSYSPLIESADKALLQSRIRSFNVEAADG